MMKVTYAPSFHPPPFAKRVRDDCLQKEYASQVGATLRSSPLVHIGRVESDLLAGIFKISTTFLSVRFITDNSLRLFAISMEEKVWQMEIWIPQFLFFLFFIKINGYRVFGSKSPEIQKGIKVGPRSDAFLPFFLPLLNLDLPASR